MGNVAEDTAANKAKIRGIEKVLEIHEQHSEKRLDSIRSRMSKLEDSVKEEISHVRGDISQLIKKLDKHIENYKKDRESNELVRSKVDLVWSLGKRVMIALCCVGFVALLGKQSGMNILDLVLPLIG